MKALLLSEYKHLTLADLPTPAPGAGEVLIRVAACGSLLLQDAIRLAIDPLLVRLGQVARLDLLVHDLLLSGGIQAGDGPVKQALLRHKTRLRSEWQRVKIKRGAKTDGELALACDDRTGR